MSDDVWVGIECDVNVSEKNGRRYARVHEAYVDAVIASGGIPLLLPPVTDARVRQAQLARVDALLLTGGDDLPASDYGEETLPCERNSSVDTRRYESGRALVRDAAARRVPTLGICYGLQLLNVALGGTLVQDVQLQIGESVSHRTGDARRDAYHEITVEEGSRLARALGTTSLSVNSAHHQSVKRPAPGLKVVGRSSDGVIEALESDDDRFLVAVQWHPERMEPGSEGFLALRALVDAARARRKK